MLRKSMNWLYGAVALGVCLISTGCCGPIGVGCGVPGDSCNDCAGTYSAERPLPYGPLDQLRQWKRSLVCGGGCGEVYYGEWMSTPPDAYDPCCGDHFVGGATKCRPFCWQPGALFGSLYGQRFCEGGLDCGCDACCDEMAHDDCGCDSCGGIVAAGGGCSTCDSGNMISGSGRFSRPPEQQIMQTQTVRQQVSRPQMQRQHVSKPHLTPQQMRARQQMQRTAQRMGTSTGGQTIRR